MKRLSAFAVLFFVIMCLFSGIGIVDAATEKDKVEPKSNSVGSESIEYYRQLYEDQKDYNDKILNTIYWALGGLATSIITVIGLNVFSNYRTNKAGMEAVKQELLKNNEETINLLITEMKVQFDDLREQNSSDILKQIDMRAEVIQEKINIIKTEIDGYKNQLLSQNEIVNSKIDRVVNNLKEKILRLEIEILENEASIYELRGVPENQVSHLCRAIDKTIALGMSLDSLLNKLLQALSNMTEILYFTSTEISSVIKKIPPKYDHLKVRLEEIIKNIRIT
jgi:hypothetical protein